MNVCLWLIKLYMGALVLGCWVLCGFFLWLIGGITCKLLLG